MKLRKNSNETILFEVENIVFVTAIYFICVCVYVCMPMGTRELGFQKS
jgi:hypothetical protein